jgi:hypothetical protein
MYGFEDENFHEACASVERARARGDFDQGSQIGAVGKAYWEEVWEDVEDVVEFEWEEECYNSRRCGYLRARNGDLHSFR